MSLLKNNAPHQQNRQYFMEDSFCSWSRAHRNPVNCQFCEILTKLPRQTKVHFYLVRLLLNHQTSLSPTPVHENKIEILRSMLKKCQHPLNVKKDMSREIMFLRKQYLWKKFQTSKKWMYCYSECWLCSYWLCFYKMCFSTGEGCVIL